MAKRASILKRNFRNAEHILQCDMVIEAVIEGDEKTRRLDYVLDTTTDRLNP